MPLRDTVTGYAPTRIRGALHTKKLEFTTTGSTQRSAPGTEKHAVATSRTPRRSRAECQRGWRCAIQ
jgi:hypothetical protein